MGVVEIEHHCEIHTHTHCIRNCSKGISTIVTIYHLHITPKHFNATFQIHAIECVSHFGSIKMFYSFEIIV